MKRLTGKVFISGVAAMLLATAGCSGRGGGGTATYKVGGTVTGLNGKLVLQNNGGNDLSVTASGTFTFTMALTGGRSYSVTVKTQPGAQSCYGTNLTGTISGANVTNVSIGCYN